MLVLSQEENLFLIISELQKLCSKKLLHVYPENPFIGALFGLPQTPGGTKPRNQVTPDPCDFVTWAPVL